MQQLSRKERSRTMCAFNRYRRILERADELRVPYEEGMSWYDRAHDRIKTLADRIKVPTERMAGAAAWLSPMTSWEKNMAGLNSLCDVWDEYPHEWKAEVANRYTTYYGNGIKAIRYLNGDGDLSGPKVRAFARNLSGDLDAVTVDSWMFKITGKFGLSSLTGNAHRAISRAVRMCATLHGISPAQAQAIIWTTERDFSS